MVLSELSTAVSAGHGVVYPVVGVVYPVVGWSNVEHGYGIGTAGFGLVSAGVIAALGVITMTAIGVARHPQWRWALACVGDATPVRRVWDWTTARLGPPTSSLRARLRLQGIAGVALIAGLVVVTLMAVGFTDLLDDVLEGDGAAVVDHRSARWLAQHRDVWSTQVLVPITHWGGPAGQAVWLVLVSALAAVRGRSWLPVLLGAVGGGGITAVVLVAKVLVGRPRPTSPFALIPTSGFSFPSGHATGAAAVGLLCAWILCRWVVRPWAAQVSVWAASGAAIGLIGFSRLYLGVHFVTDVLAGWLLGAAWAGVVVLAGSWWSPWPDRGGRPGRVPPHRPVAADSTVSSTRSGHRTSTHRSTDEGWLHLYAGRVLRLARTGRAGEGQAGGGLSRDRGDGVEVLVDVQDGQAGEFGGGGDDEVGN